MNILIVKIGAIGDVAMATSIIPAIKLKHPNASITWVTGILPAPLLRAIKGIENVIVVNEKRLLTGSFFQKLLELISLWLRLAFSSFDLCLTLHPDPRYRCLTWPIRCPTRRFWSRSKTRPHPIPGRYHAEEYVRLFTQSEEACLSGVSFPLLDLPSIEQLKGRYRDLPWVVLAPGGAKNILADDALRRWPIEHYASLLRELSKTACHLMVIGTSQDLWVRPYFAGISYIDLIGELNLLELLSLLQASKLLITHDSGPLHLAKLVHCPVLALFGPTQPEEKVGANEKVTVLWKKISFACSPCYDGKCYAPCKKNRCLEEILPEEVLRVCLEKLSLSFN